MVTVSHYQWKTPCEICKLNFYTGVLQYIVAAVKHIFALNVVTVIHLCMIDLTISSIAYLSIWHDCIIMDMTVHKNNTPQVGDEFLKPIQLLQNCGRSMCWQWGAVSSKHIFFKYVLNSCAYITVSDSSLRGALREKNFRRQEVWCHRRWKRLQIHSIYMHIWLCITHNRKCT